MWVSKKKFCLRFVGAPAQHRGPTSNRTASAAVLGVDPKMKNLQMLAHRKKE